jgi:4a-hydroxytetrahydrobiopterin dehydratase
MIDSDKAERDRQLWTPEQIAALCQSCSGWKAEHRVLVREYSFVHFRAAFAFVSEAALLCERHNHHAAISLDYGEVVIRTTSHDVGGLTERDGRLVRSLDKVLARHQHGQGA